jgi:hypothetical protein
MVVGCRDALANESRPSGLEHTPEVDDESLLTVTAKAG